MSDKATIVEGVNCPKARWTYRGICMLASVVWFTMIAVELFWPELCPWLSEVRLEKEQGNLVVVSAPFLIYAFVVVWSLSVPVPASFGLASDWRLTLSGYLTVMSVGITYGVATRRAVEQPILSFCLVSGLFAALPLVLPVKYVCVQHVVYTNFVLALIGYLDYRLPIRPSYHFLAALIAVIAFLSYAVLRLNILEPPEPEPEQDCKLSPV